MRGGAHRYNSTEDVTKFDCSNNNEAFCKQGLTAGLNKNIVRVEICVCKYKHISLFVYFLLKTFFSSRLLVLFFFFVCTQTSCFCSRRHLDWRKVNKILERVAWSFIFKNFNKYCFCTLQICGAEKCVRK